MTELPEGWEHPPRSVISGWRIGKRPVTGLPIIRIHEAKSWLAAISCPRVTTSYRIKRRRTSSKKKAGSGSERAISERFRRTDPSRLSVCRDTKRLLRITRNFFILIFIYVDPNVSQHSSTDRKKDLVKLQLGEYVSLGKVESELKTCPAVENICVYGDANKAYTVALIVPNSHYLEEIASNLGIISKSFEELCSNPQIEKMVLQDLVEQAKKCTYFHANCYYSGRLLSWVSLNLAVA